MRKTKYTDQDIIEKSKTVNSIAGLLSALSLRPAGGNYANIKRKLQKLHIDTSHWGGKGWSKDKQLKDWSKYTKAKHCKKHLIKERGYICDECQITDWRGKPLVLEIDHIDGDRTNNSLNNLRLLCPNCHSQTPTWKNRTRYI